MKKILFFSLLISLFAFNAFAQMGSAYNSVKKKLNEMTRLEGGEVCLDDGTGVMRKTSRRIWELGFRGNLLDTPNGGAPAFRTENLDLTIYHNLSNFFHVYATYGNRTVEKNGFRGQEFANKWQNRHFYGGFGIYLNPMISIYGGFGKIWAQDTDGNEPNIRTAIEKGLAFDLPIWGNKLRLEYRIVDAPMADEDIPIEQSTGDAGFSALSISFVVGL